MIYSTGENKTMRGKDALAILLTGLIFITAMGVMAITSITGNS